MIMIVEFHRTDEKHYAVIVPRQGLPSLEINPAPGFDLLMPHDMLHFLVEQELGLQNAIYGQIARGGTAGSFQNKPSESSNNRADSRLRRKDAKRGEKLLKKGIDQCAQSERATYVCWYDWLAHSDKPELQNKAKEMKETALSILGQISNTEKSAFNQKNLAKIRRRLDEASQQWSGLKVGESMSLKW